MGANDYMDIEKNNRFLVVAKYRTHGVKAHSSMFFFQAEGGIRDAQESRGLGDAYERQGDTRSGITSASLLDTEAGSGDGRGLSRSISVNETFGEFSPSLCVADAGDAIGENESLRGVGDVANARCRFNKLACALT